MKVEMEFLISLMIGMIFGSLPTAYILMKRLKGVNITEAGSGNVGALNSFEVSNSYIIGIVVFIIDFAKGLAAVYLVQNIFGDDFLYSSLAITGAVVSHCYSPWINFRGGRGLATALGGSILFAYAIPVIWIAFWIVAYLFRRHIHFANMAATILTGAIALSNSDILNKYTLERADENWIFGISVAFVMTVIMSKHIEPFKEWFLNQKRKSIRDTNETN